MQKPFYAVWSRAYFSKVVIGVKRVLHRFKRHNDTVVKYEFENKLAS